MELGGLEPPTSWVRSDPNDIWKGADLEDLYWQQSSGSMGPEYAYLRTFLGGLGPEVGLWSQTKHAPACCACCGFSVLTSRHLQSGSGAFGSLPVAAGLVCLRPGPVSYAAWRRPVEGRRIRHPE
jgi:hypothetical protein